MDHRVVLSVLPLLLPATVRADVTVFFAPPPPPAPLVAEAVCPSPALPDATAAAWPAVAGPEVEEAVLAGLGASGAPVTRPFEEPAGPSATEAARADVHGEREEDAPDPAADRDGSERTDAEGVGVDAAPLPNASDRDVRPISVASSAEPARTATVRFVRVGDGSRESIEVALLDADGRPSPEALAALSLLARPRDARRPDARELAAHASDLEWVATGIRRLHPGLLLRLHAIAERFGPRPVEIVSGYRPDARETSRHRIGSALDLRLVGVAVEELDAFAATLPETGVGLYPTSRFVHLDVRERRTHWVDLSGPGEPPGGVVDTRAPATADRVDGDALAPAGDPVDEAAIVAAFHRGLRGVDLGP